MDLHSTDIIEAEQRCTLANVKLKNSSILRSTSRLEKNATAFLSDILSAYSQLMDIKHQEVRRIMEESKAEKSRQLQVVETLFELSKFGFHLPLETRHQILFTELEVESSPAIRCEKAVQETVLEAPSDRNEGVDSLLNRLKIVKVFKVDNAPLLSKYQVKRSSLELSFFYCDLLLISFFYDGVRGLRKVWRER